MEARGPHLSSLEFFVDEGYVQFDSEAFTRYLNQLRDEACDEYPWLSDSLEGTLPLGRECFKSIQCESDYCDGCPGVCTELPEAGDSCQDDDIFCGVSSLVCLEGSCIDFQTLENAEGERCGSLESGALGGGFLSLSDGCEEGLYCNRDQQMCLTYIREGEVALVGEVCEPGLFVDDDDRCRLPQVVSSAGNTCDATLYLCDWSSGLTCQPSSLTDEFSCQRAPQESESCTERSRLFQTCDPRQPLYCGEDGLCHRKKRVGASCEASYECQTTSCDSSTETCREPDYLSCASPAGSGSGSGSGSGG